MRLLLLISATLALIAMSGTASHAQQANYAGSDAGILVYSAGSVGIPMNFSFRYRSVALTNPTERAWSGTIGCGCVGTFGPRRDFDYTGDESGKVTTRRLPPGDYEIYDFGFGGSLGTAITTYSSGRPFVIPFTVRTGEATYIGNFARAVSLGTTLQPVLGATGYFIVSDQGDRDLAIARRRDPSLFPVSRAVTDVSTIGHPALRSAGL